MCFSEYLCYNHKFLLAQLMLPSCLTSICIASVSKIIIMADITFQIHLLQEGEISRRWEREFSKPLFAWLHIITIRMFCSNFLIWRKPGRTIGGYLVRMIFRFLETYLTKISFFSYFFRSTIILSTSAIKILLEHLNYPSSMIRSDHRIRSPAAAAAAVLLWVLGERWEGAVWVLGIFFYDRSFPFLSFHS